MTHLGWSPQEFKKGLKAILKGGEKKGGFLTPSQNHSHKGVTDSDRRLRSRRTKRTKKLLDEKRNLDGRAKAPLSYAKAVANSKWP